ncbi:hypothetical protein FGB62_1g315 [Gracilaria domingensis]|nr:hypothetical protein FGB62_1g315 [Gracilaria domingensis]
MWRLLHTYGDALWSDLNFDSPHVFLHLKADLASLGSSPSPVIWYRSFVTNPRLLRRGILSDGILGPFTSRFLGGRCGGREKDHQRVILVTKTQQWRVAHNRMTCLETSVSRRDMMRWAIAGISLFSLGQTPQSVEAALNPFASPPDLVKRLKQKTSEEMTERLFQEDLYYPDFFAGTWKTSSTLLSVACPAGYKLFGRTGSFEEAKKIVRTCFVGHTCRALEKACSTRVGLCARATLGPYSVLHCEALGNTANRLAVSSRPDGTDGSVYQVDLRTIARHEQMDKLPMQVESAFRVGEDSVWKNAESRADDWLEEEPKDGLYTSEVVRQDVRLDTDDMRVQPLIKHVETSAIFTWDDERDDFFSAWQKTSTFLTRTNLMYVDARGRPVDVRWYKVEYSRG